MITAGSDHVRIEAEPERFGVLLRRFRFAAGLSQERLAELARLSSEAIGALERGTRLAPQRQTLALLIEALALAPAEREALTVAAVRPPQPRQRTPRASQSPVSFLLAAPSALTSFVGRESDLAAVLALCRSARWTTIVGPGGVGKSRLALETARAAVPFFPDGIATAALAPLIEHAPVLPMIAAALGVRDDGPVSLGERVAGAVGRRSMLLILDNCEQVLDELAAAVAQLLGNCPGLRVLATSREALRADGERIYRLQPLSIGHAVDVFIDRAKANGFDPTNSERDLSLAAEICDRLDRMPLAIELAASCSDVLAFEAILTRLRERATLPARPTRAARPQHRSMQALVEWSYDRLDPNAAAAFRRFVPFVGGCRLDDAQEIIGEGTLSHDDVLYGLFRLHEQSLLDADRAAVPRFQMLQTIRDFAALRLGDEERGRLNRRFALHYFSTVAGCDAALRSPDQQRAIERIAAESANLRAALESLRTDPAVARSGLAALGALSHYCLRTGTLTEAAEIYAALDFTQFPPSAELAAALCGAAFVEVNRRFLTTALAYARRAGTVAHAAGARWFEIYAKVAEHTIARRAKAPDAAEPFEPYYAQAQELGDPWLLGTAAFRMAELSGTDVASCDRYLGYALTCAESSGDAFAIQSIQLALARSTARRDPRRAAAVVSAVWAQLGPQLYVPQLSCLEILADIAIGLGQFDDAAFVTGFGSAILRAIGSPNAARVQIDAFGKALERTHAAALAAGEAASWDEATARVGTLVRGALA